ncbi:hypothetical protein [uncultured Streptomyces sp.]|uniref:hypothetical protein n=1 Tax=uncultured Streptomyces sp. TaxID=174707 RepID=UPI002620BBB8|nr:hypothetical protein [uncultured Streptomyces sp.]
MTQNGQGDDRQLPAVRPAHEGVVLPSDGGAPWHPGQSGPTPPGQAAPTGGSPWGQPWGPDAPQQGGGGPSGDQGAYDPYGQQQPDPYGQGAPQQSGYGRQQPDPYGQGAQQQGGQQPYPPQGQPLPPAQQQPPAPYAQPLPPEAPAGAPLGQGGGDADATQYIAPVPGGMPPVRGAQGQQPGSSGQEDATQYIPPVPGGDGPYGIRPGGPEDRQPPAEFDNLFRDEAPSGATQQMPMYDQRQAHQQPPQQTGYGRQAPQQPYGRQQPQQGYPGGQLPPQAAQPYAAAPQGYQGGYPDDGPEEAPRRRRSPHIPLIAAVVVGCAVVGLGAGALMSGGDDDPDDKQPVASQSSSAPQSSGTPAEDPAKPQAVALDALLADSNDSRSMVIGAVEKIKACKDLDQAAADLKSAAQQRRDLVTRLGEISVDKLPDHATLTSSLTRAWEASASADDHYAAWAVQAKTSKKVCKGGHAANTKETSKAAEQSGVASKAKNQASGLWNKIADSHGLTRRQSTQL